MNELISAYLSRPLDVILHLIMLCGSVYGAWRWRQLSFVAKMMWALLCITLITELTAYYFGHVYKRNTLVYNCYNLLQFSLVTYMYHAETRYKMILPLWVASVGFAVYKFISCADVVTVQLFSDHIMLNALFMVVYAMLLFAKNLQPQVRVPLKDQPLFWLSCGLLLFSVVSIVSFGFIKLADKDSDWMKAVKWIRTCTNYLFYLTFLIAFRSPQKSLHEAAAGQ